MLSSMVEILQMVYEEEIISQLLDELMNINELDDSRGGVAKMDTKPKNRCHNVLLSGWDSTNGLRGGNNFPTFRDSVQFLCLLYLS